VRFVIVAPVTRRLCSPVSGRKSTYQTVQIREAGSEAEIARLKKKLAKLTYEKPKTQKGAPKTKRSTP
jgi:hypothetical protein